MIAPAIQTFPQLAIGSPEWLAFRKTGIGASEVGAVLGVCPWKSPVDVWLEKMGRVHPFDGNKSTKRGQELEDIVCRHYAEDTGLKVRRFNYTLRRGVLIGDLDRLVHPEGKLPAVADRIVTDRAMDAKTAKDRSLWADGLPMYYEAQGLSYMALCPTVELFDFAVQFMLDWDFQIYPMKRDDESIAQILDRLEEWWQRHVVEETAPDPLSEDDCKKLWGRHRPATVCFATENVSQALVDIAAAKADQKNAKAAEEQARLVVMQLMQDSEVLKSADGTKVLATWKSAKDSEKVDWEAVARELPSSPELFEATVRKFTTVTAGSRRFLPKE